MQIRYLIYLQYEYMMVFFLLLTFGDCLVPKLVSMQYKIYFRYIYIYKTSNVKRNPNRIISVCILVREVHSVCLFAKRGKQSATLVIYKLIELEPQSCV